jgi:gluconokinase
MGVSGSGKSSIGKRLAQVIGAQFIDGDDLHPPANIQKMASGIPLNDDDRTPWFKRIRGVISSFLQKNETGVIACSALKRKYRDFIRNGNKDLTFLFLDGDYELIARRMKARLNHFMSLDMLKSQLDTLERPSDEPDVISIDIDGSIEDVVQLAISKLTDESNSSSSSLYRDS